MSPKREPLAEQLLEVVRALDPVTEQALTVAQGATLSQLAALRVLASGGSSVTGLATALGTHRSSASRMVDRLVAAGLAEKAPSPTSQREVVVTATAKGRSAAQAVARSRLTALSRLLRPLGEEDRQVVAGALDILLSQLTSQQSGH